MDSVQKALKSSTRNEMAVKLSLPVAVDDSLAVSTHNGVSPDDFSVDDLLDLSSGDVFTNEEAEKGDEPQEQHEGPQDDENKLRRISDFSAADDFGSLPTSELSVPADDLANLEWLSHFVEDSFSEYSTPYLTDATKGKPSWLIGYRNDLTTPVNEESCFKAPVPGKARSERARTGRRVWSLGSPSFSESSSSSTTSSSSSSTPSCPWVIGSEILVPVSSERPPAPKRQKRKRAEAAGGQQQPRRCSHCGVQKTPQWRAGPMGAKTLCNACGVRYKSGRLLPEYRPACSPTFCSELHSNHHRKVLEMRRKKEVEQGLDQVRPVVPSF